MGFHKNLRGPDLHAPSNELIENNSGVDVQSLSVVTLDGAGNIYPQIKIAEPITKHNFGVANGLIQDGSTGYVTTLGLLSDIDTALWAEGSILYSDASGQLSESVYGKPVAIVVKQDALLGQIYVLTASTLGYPYSWDLKGNAGTNPSSDFIGTLDSVPLKFKTNNNQVGQFDESGKFAIGPHTPLSPLHIKPYPGYDKSGFRLDSFSLTASSAVYNDIYIVYLTNQEILKIKIQLIARQSDGVERACFTRSGLFYKQNGNVRLEGQMQSDFTMKSNKEFDISWYMGTNYVIFKVKNAQASETYWSGHVELESLMTDA